MGIFNGTAVKLGKRFLTKEGRAAADHVKAMKTGVETMQESVRSGIRTQMEASLKGATSQQAIDKAVHNYMGGEGQEAIGKMMGEALSGAEAASADAASAARKNIFARHPFLTAAGLGGVAATGISAMSGPDASRINDALMAGQRDGAASFQQNVVGPMVTANMAGAGYEGRVQGQELGRSA
jgi:hypothetical protein